MSREGRTELDTLLTFLRPDDTLVVTKVDRLARSVGELHDIVKALRAKGVGLKVTDQAIDTSSAADKAFLEMLGVFAESFFAEGPGWVEMHSVRWRSVYLNRSRCWRRWQSEPNVSAL